MVLNSLFPVLELIMLGRALKHYGLTDAAFLSRADRLAGRPRRPKPLQVTEFPAKAVQIIARNGVGHLVGLLDGMPLDAVIGLLPVPWTFLPEPLHD